MKREQVKRERKSFSDWVGSFCGWLIVAFVAFCLSMIAVTGVGNATGLIKLPPDAPAPTPYAQVFISELAQNTPAVSAYKEIVLTGSPSQIKFELLTKVNSGNYNIVRVLTDRFRDDFTDWSLKTQRKGDLKSAEIHYIDNSGPGNDIRMRIINGNEAGWMFYWDFETYIRQQAMNFMSDIRYEVLASQEVMNSRNLKEIVVFYREKNTKAVIT